MDHLGIIRNLDRKGKEAYVKKIGYHELERSITYFMKTRNGGINTCIFGGYVRDTIRREEIKKEFEKNHGLDHEKFYDSKFDPSTKDRFLCSKDIDVRMKEFSKLNKDFVKVIEDNDYLCFKSYNGFYESDEFGMENVKSYPFNVQSIRFFIPNLSFFTGIGADFFQLDIVNFDSPKLFPPFGFGDFECNCFIESYVPSSGQFGRFLSRNIGNKLDKCTYEDHKKEEKRIRKDIKEKKTNYIPIHTLYDYQDFAKDITDQAIEFRKRRFKRVFSMFSKGWSIENIPQFKMTRGGSDDVCLICRTELENDKCIQFTCCKIVMCNPKKSSCVTDYFISGNRKNKIETIPCPHCKTHLKFL
jgi:hypothetical protein